ncbi:phosphotransferase [Streptomyces nanshensis]|uniref:Aminoglycoside phosphotransferase n=1 Tax=Streptomyces nanshensis TaxID=518642 RepID=A0A1E7KZH5_9ACTN|nr:phosphotransferase [Streptomyces nanshensis]OEV09322.1 aminoglycoside phosphotransferase [Streptomyces nanshensis]
MPVTRLQWEDLPLPAQDAVEEVTGPIHRAETVSGGYNSAIAARLDTETGTVFLKGLPASHPRAWTQRREAEVAAAVGTLAPRFRWRLETAEWDLLGFDFAAGRHADYASGSPDLALLACTLTRLAEIPAPRTELKRAEERWASYLPDADHRAALAGQYLAHTDFNPENVLITPGGAGQQERALMVDWAWSTLGAPWLDPALACVWLVSTGKQHPGAAEKWAARMPAWRGAPSHVLTAFAEANAKLWTEIADESPGTWSASLRDGARRYAAYRSRS